MGLSNENILAILAIIVNMCQDNWDKQTCVAKYEHCVSINHQTIAWPTRLWTCLRDPTYPNDEGHE